MLFNHSQHSLLPSRRLDAALALLSRTGYGRDLLLQAESLCCVIHTS